MKGRIANAFMVRNYLWIGPVATLFVFWEIFARIVQTSHGNIPTFTSTLMTLVASISQGEFLFQILHTLLALTIGVTIATGLAMPMAVLAGVSRQFDSFLTPTAMLVGATPDLALLPIMRVLLKESWPISIVIAIVSSFFILYFTVRNGVKQIPVDVFAIAKAFGAKKWQIFRTAIMPGVLPHLITGLRLAFDLSWEVVLAVEIYFQTVGIGSLVQSAAQVEHLDLALAGVLAVGSISLLSDRMIFSPLEVRARRWMN